ncbi:MAG: ATP synthase F0 subunit B [Opitutus sp.]|nr:ATP synthase F0 subunit B [Opitutus sp.]
MLSHLILLAQAAAHGEAASGVSKILGDFGISWPFILAQILNFSVVAFILWKFAFQPVLATLDERQQKIAVGLKYADDMKAKLDATKQETAALLKQASVEASRIIDEARKSAKDHLDKQVQEATAKANEALAKGQQSIELEHKKMLADARHEIARLVVTTTERVLAKKLTEADRAAYNDAASRELTNA